MVIFSWRAPRFIRKPRLPPLLGQPLHYIGRRSRNENKRDIRTNESRRISGDQRPSVTHLAVSFIHFLYLTRGYKRIFSNLACFNGEIDFIRDCLYFWINRSIKYKILLHTWAKEVIFGMQSPSICVETINNYGDRNVSYVSLMSLIILLTKRIFYSLKLQISIISYMYMYIYLDISISVHWESHFPSASFPKLERYSIRNTLPPFLTAPTVRDSHRQSLR